MTAASIHANVPNPISRRVLVSRMLQVAALQAAIAGALYLTIVLPRRIEWFDAAGTERATAEIRAYYEREIGRRDVGA